jgi:hypothetical protein
MINSHYICSEKHRWDRCVVVIYHKMNTKPARKQRSNDDNDHFSNFFSVGPAELLFPHISSLTLLGNNRIRCYAINIRRLPNNSDYLSERNLFDL